MGNNRREEGLDMEKKLYQEKTRLLTILNYSLKSFLFFIVFFLIFLGINKVNLVFAGTISLFYTVIFNKVLRTKEKDKIRIKTRDLKEKIEQDLFWKKIKSFDQYSFINYVKNVLDNLPSFSNVKVIDEGLYLEALFNNEIFVIKCFLNDGEDSVESYSVRNFSRLMNEKGYKKGIIISTTDFREDAKYFCQLISNQRKIFLFGKDKFLQMVKESNLYTSSQETMDAIIKRREYKERIWRNKRKIFAKPNISKYLYSAIFLLMMTNFIPSQLNFFYYTCAFILLFISFITYWLNNRRVIKEKSWREDLIN